MNSANSEGQNPNLNDNGAATMVQNNSTNNGQMQNSQNDQAHQQQQQQQQQHHPQQQNAQTVSQQPGNQNLLSNHHGGGTVMPGLPTMDANEVERNDVTGMNSNLYPPSSVSGDETGEETSELVER